MASQRGTAEARRMTASSSSNPGGGHANPHLFTRQFRFEADARWERDVVYVKPLGNTVAIHAPDGRELGRCSDWAAARVVAAAQDLVALSVH